MDQKKITEKLLEMLHNGLIPLTEEAQKMADEGILNPDDGWNVPYIGLERASFPGRVPVYLKDLNLQD